MSRVHLIELHEQSWYPGFLRRMFQQFLGLMIVQGGFFKALAPKFDDFLEKSQANCVLDLCSGSGQAVTHLMKLCNQVSTGDRRVKLLLSDLYPDTELLARIKQQSLCDVDYYLEPVDALSPPIEGRCAFTIINTLHHFRPAQVRRILANASKNSKGIAVIEVTNRNWSSVLFTLTSPFVTAVVAAVCLRPFRIWHVIFSLIIPVIPLTVLIDGIVSCLRSYTKEELEEIVSSPECAEFEWEVGSVKSIGPKSLNLMYLFGTPKSKDSYIEI